MSVHEHPYFGVWASMKDRCNNPNSQYFHNYGGRGIKVCERWRKFINFAEDMGHRPEGYTLERIDNDKGYEPDNCRWASRHEQNRNTRTNRWLELDGNRYLMGDLAIMCGKSEATLREHLKNGKTLQEAMVRKVRPTNAKNLTAADKNEIRRLVVEDRLSQEAAGKRYGVTQSYVSVLLHGRAR